jgi:hypothetical protein
MNAETEDEMETIKNSADIVMKAIKQDIAVGR